MKTARLRWFLIISIMIHALFLWVSSFMPPYEPKPESPIDVRLLVIRPPPPQEKPRPPQKKPSPPKTQPPSPRQKPPPPQEKPLPPQARSPLPQEKPSRPEMPTTSAPSPTRDKPSLPPNQIMEPPPREETPIPAEEVSSASLLAEFPYAGHPMFDSEPFLDIDHYTLQGYNMLGTDLCVDGDQLRSKERQTITQFVIDYSKCRIRTRSDDEEEVCREDHKYEGIWAVGTQFQYKCKKQVTRIYRRPLQYTVRYIVQMEMRR